MLETEVQSLRETKLFEIQQIQRTRGVRSTNTDIFSCLVHINTLFIRFDCCGEVFWWNGKWLNESVDVQLEVIVKGKRTF